MRNCKLPARMNPSSLREDEQLATLEELFEFIDCWVSPDVFSDSISIDCESIKSVSGCCEPITLCSIESKSSEHGSPTTVDQATPQPPTQVQPYRPSQSGSGSARAGAPPRAAAPQEGRVTVPPRARARPRGVRRKAQGADRPGPRDREQGVRLARAGRG